MIEWLTPRYLLAQADLLFAAFSSIVGMFEAPLRNESCPEGGIEGLLAAIAVTYML